MTRVIEQLAELTGFRDRDTVDATLVSALRDLLAPREVGIHRLVGQGDGRRWLTRARLAAGDEVPSADPPWIPMAHLPAAEAHPDRLLACSNRATVQLSEGLGCVFPLGTDRDAEAVVELLFDAPPDADALRLVDSVLRIYRNFQSLLDDNERDSLTGLLNRKTFDATFYRMVSETQQGEAAAGATAVPRLLPADRRFALKAQRHFIGVVDIDHFKRVNDRFGHLIGDEVLLLMSRLMRANFRYDDRLFRFGGEEFVVLLRCPLDTGAHRALERLRTRVGSYAFPQVGAITISIGYAEVRPDETPARAFERADRAVYWAKAHGRDQVCSHEHLLAEGLIVDEGKVGDIELF